MTADSETEGAGGARRSHRLRNRLIEGGLVIVVALVLVVRALMTADDKRGAIEWSGLGEYVNVGDVQWVSADGERGGMTYRYFAIIPASRMSPTRLGRLETEDHFLVRDTVTRPESSHEIYRTISYFRNSAGLADRKVSLVVGVSSSARELAG